MLLLKLMNAGVSHVSCPFLVTNDLYLIWICEKLQKIRAYEKKFWLETLPFLLFVLLFLTIKTGSNIFLLEIVFSCKTRDIICLIQPMYAQSICFIWWLIQAEKKWGPKFWSKNFSTAGSDGKWFFNSSIPISRTFVIGSWTLVLQTNSNDGKIVLLTQPPLPWPKKRKLLSIS